MGSPVRVFVPATTANLGPGFDCLALALDLWNQTVFTLCGEGVKITCQGEGTSLPLDERNLILQAMRLFYDTYGLPFPRGLRIDCQNGIPVSSGLGSSAAAILTGLLGAAALLDVPLPPGEALALAARMEGHADNAAAALHGGLVVVAAGARGWITRRIEIPATGAVVVVPSVPLSTHTARTALPQEISLRDATFNLGRAILVVEALRSGDLDLLRQAIDDRLHLPYRLPMIPGGAEAMQQAAAAGASAVTISGAGPSLIAFASANQAAIGETMACAFLQAGIPARVFLVTTTGLAAHIAQ